MAHGAGGAQVGGRAATVGEIVMLEAIILAELYNLSGDQIGEL